ncbi:putative pilus assembly protein FilE [Acinetobacter rongchengensis]|uniref:Putative pilus assembly protein FilE n=1 Tax=Acinetobacter rongchengensis TaxID=2419601 RepID=A0A3A8EQH7_9GAMM|nr:putative pilus assembly protein FilE [Acinetobacter rongchengensis]RKG36399.1 putative pilus assembly protein FilE [Acinetobacter rongchengensis]
MRLKMSNTKALKPLWLALGMSLAITTPYAANFYTIIGPDGHPMIVQKPIDTKEISKKQTAKIQEPQKQIPKSADTQIKNTELAPVIQNKQVIDQQSKAQPVLKNKPIETQTNSQVSVPQQHKSESKHKIEQQKEQQKTNVTDLIIIQQEDKQTQKSSVVLVEKTQPTPVVQSLPSKQPVKNIEQTAVIAESSTQNLASSQTQVQQKQSENNHFTVIDGEKYVNNEYLEDQEFNLEGKKRFYMTPEVGAVHGRYETIERQKGLSASLLDRIRGNSKVVENKAIVLAPTYYRLPQNEVIQNLEKSCFTGKKVQKAKKLSIKNQELGIWPVAPIKESFAYEVVELDSQVQNVLLTSYASSSKIPSYYWPLVVFLDQQGCVLEGVSGFKNEEMQDNNIQFSAMEGVLRKPEKAVYMFLTPLASAIDVENKQLTNHGQIKLSVIQ